MPRRLLMVSATKASARTLVTATAVATRSLVTTTLVTTAVVTTRSLMPATLVTTAVVTTRSLMPATLVTTAVVTTRTLVTTAVVTAGNAVSAAVVTAGGFVSAAAVSTAPRHHVDHTTVVVAQRRSVRAVVPGVATAVLVDVPARVTPHSRVHPHRLAASQTQVEDVRAAVTARQRPTVQVHARTPRVRDLHPLLVQRRVAPRVPARRVVLHLADLHLRTVREPPLVGRRRQRRHTHHHTGSHRGRSSTTNHHRP